MRENSRFECLANIRCKKENRADSIKMVVLFQNPSAYLKQRDFIALRSGLQAYYFSA